MMSKYKVISTVDEAIWVEKKIGKEEERATGMILGGELDLRGLGFPKDSMNSR